MVLDQVISLLCLQYFIKFNTIRRTYSNWSLYVLKQNVVTCKQLRHLNLTNLKCPRLPTERSFNLLSHNITSISYHWKYRAALKSIDHQVNTSIILVKNPVGILSCSMDTKWSVHTQWSKIARVCKNKKAFFF